MGRLPAAMPSTINAADHLRRSIRLSGDRRRKVLDLLLVLAAVECHASVGGPAAVPPALLRDLVILTGRLAGHTLAGSQRWYNGCVHCVAGHAAAAAAART